MPLPLTKGMSGSLSIIVDTIMAFWSAASNASHTTSHIPKIPGMFSGVSLTVCFSISVKGDILFSIFSVASVFARPRSSTK